MDTQFAPCPYIVHTFLPSKKGQPLNNGQNACLQLVHYSEVPLTNIQELHNGLIKNRGPNSYIGVYPAHSLQPTVTLCFVQGDTSFRTETSGYFCPEHGDTKEVLYYNDLATILFHPQETAIKQLFHQNGEKRGTV